MSTENTTRPLPSARARPFLATALMIASGFAALGYQIVWTQQSAVWLGHETAAVLAVVAAFFGGLALGAWGFGSCISRSAHPVRWYAACELVIALWCLALAWLMAPLGEWLVFTTGPHPQPAWQWTVAFVGTFVLLLPATAAMGATLPAMERVLAAMRSDGRSIAVLYASNTLGAVLGVLLVAFWLVPDFGLVRTTLLCASLNVACAVLALRLRHVTVRPPTVSAIPAWTPRARHLGALLFMTGMLGIGFEVLVVRVLSQVAENTVYTFAMLLAVYLAGTATGAAVYQRWLAGTDAPDRMRIRLVCALSMACLLSISALWGAQDLLAWVRESLRFGVASALAGEAALALVAFALPTLVMGALFSHLSTQAREAGVPLGRALAINTFGAAAAPGLLGVLLVPAVGTKATLLLIASGYLVLVLAKAWKTPLLWAPAVAAVTLTVWAPPLAFVDVPQGGRIVSYREGAMAAVSVVEDAQGVMRLRIDNRQQEGSSSSYYADARQAALPLLLHPAPRSALFLGLGTGVTATSATMYPGLQVDAVELLPDVIAASALFTQGREETAAPRLQLMAADARRFVRASAKQYDVIVSDNFHPARSGSGSLYTVEHFQAVRQRLASGGTFVQWLPLHQMDLVTLQSIVQSFVKVYPQALAMLATHSLDTPVIGLVGRVDPLPFDLVQVATNTQTSGWARTPAGLGLVDGLSVLGSFVAGPSALARFAGVARANTDDRPVVAYRAPRITYAPDSRPRDRLIELLQQWDIAPADVLDSQASAASQVRMQAYWSARTRYIDIGRNIQPSADVRVMLRQLREPLLSVLRTSPDFHPAYEPLLQMAGALASTDPASAMALLTELSRLQPARDEAAQALATLRTSAH